MIKIYIAGHYPDYGKWFNFPVQEVDSPEKSDLIIFAGGTDVNSILYEEPPHESADYPDIARDIREEKLYENFVGKKPMLGICRGSQFLTVMNGGSLVQHVNNHAGGGHWIQDVKTSAMYKDTSGHHQMMWPYSLDENEYELIALASTNRSNVYLGLSLVDEEFIQKKDLKETEIVFYPKTNCLCIQGHPEWGYPTPYSDYCNDLVQVKLLQTKKQMEYEY